MRNFGHVLVHVGDSQRSHEVLRCAARIAAAHDAGVSAVHAVQPPHLGAYISPETAMAAAQYTEDALRKRVARAREAVLDADRAIGTQIDFDSPGGDPVATMTGRSRVSDLVVVGQPAADDADGPSPRFASQLLVGAGCPVLFVPHTGRFESCGTNVLVAWAATRESARALHDALPILQRAQRVELVRIGTSPQAGVEEPLDAVVAYLSTHGVSVTCAIKPVREISIAERMLTPTVVDASIAELLLSHAADIDADLIVMGGYGHARAYEFLLGGVTRTMLASMTVPVLMSH